MKQGFKLIGMALISASLLACASYPTVNEDPAKNNQATFQKDALDCAKDYPEAGGKLFILENME